MIAPSLTTRHRELRESIQPWWMKATLLLTLFLFLAFVAGVRVNLSRSLPLGLYQRVSTESEVRRGSIVIVCLPEEWGRFASQRGILGTGSCPGGSYGLGKIVVAAGGDLVTISAGGIYVHERLLPDGAPLALDELGRKLPTYPPGSYTLGSGELWLYSPHQTSFDSRYFGPVERSSVQAVIKPILVRR